MIIPSIDLQNGRAVQLRQGRDLLLESDRDPVELAREFGRFGPVAVIDLDAALGRGNNKELIARCCEVAACRVGGGLRDADSIRDAIRQGASQVIVGTAAEPELLRQFAPEQLIVALDTRGDTVLSHGWTESTDRRLMERGRALAPFCAEFLFTQVEREGMLAGADLERARELARVTNRPVTVAGGIRDSEEVAALQREGFNTQIGRALYEGSIDLVQSVHRSLLVGLQADKFDISTPEKLVGLVAPDRRRTGHQSHFGQGR